MNRCGAVFTVKVQKKYHSLGHKVLLVKVEKEKRTLGIALSGHKDRNRMAVFICGLNPKGSAFKGGQLVVGDEILEVRSLFPRLRLKILSDVPPRTREIDIRQ